MPDSPVALLTRLLPPRRPPGLIARPALAERLSAGLPGRVTAVVAGAGYGKTTALVEALNQAPWPWVWCSCDERLDPSPLLTHLVAALQNRLPGFGASLHLAGPLSSQVSVLANEIVTTLADDLIIAFDDVHALPSASSEVLAELVRDLPPTIHFAIASRAPLTFLTARFRALGLREFGERELAFRRDEAEALLRETAPALDSQTAAEIVRRTEGWVAGLILAARAAEAGTGQSAGSRRGDLFEYLAEEVFDAQPEDVQRFLLDTAVFDRFTPDLAKDATGRADASEVCHSLVERHLFTVCLDERARWYRYHHLFQAVLRQKTLQEGEQALRERHRRAAAAWLAQEAPAEAVGHLMAAGDHEAAADALEAIAEQMVGSSEAAGLGRWLAALPEEQRRSRPSLILAESSLTLNRGQFAEAFAALGGAVERLLAMGEHDRAAVAFARALFTHTASGTSHDRAIEIGERYIPLIDPGAEMLPIVRLLLATSYGWAGRFADAERQVAAAQTSPAADRIPLLDAYVLMVRAHWIDRLQGRVHEALRGLDRGVELLAANPEADTLGLIVQARGYRAFALTVTGFHEEALAEGERLVEAAEERGAGPFVRRAAAWLRLLALTPLGRWEELESTLADLASESGRLEGTPAGHAFLAFSARLAAHRGDADGVATYVSAALEAISESGPELDQIGNLCELALASDAVGLRELAASLAQQALHTGQALAMPWHLARAAMVAAHCLRADPAGEEALDVALALTDQHGYEALWSRRERALAPPLLARALHLDLGPPGLAARLAAHCGGEVFRHVAGALRGAPASARAALAEAAGDAPNVDAEALHQLISDRDADVRAAARRARSRRAGLPRLPLRLVGLGGFAVFRGGGRVPHVALGRDRAPQVLAALLCAGRPVPREQLAEWIWPDAGPASAARRLSGAVRTLRRELEPHLEHASAPSVVAQEQDALSIALRADDSWDVDEFLGLAHAAVGGKKAGGKGLQSLLAAEAAYSGRLLPEWPDAAWAAARRAEVDELLQAVLGRLATGLLDVGRAAEAASRYRRLIELEPESEAAHRGLIRAYAAAGERALALRQYQACRTILRRRHGVEPAPETRALYQELVGDDPQALLGLPDGTVTIVFTDIEASTELTARIGDRRWAELLSHHDEAMRRVAAAHGGVEVKSQGDGLMLAFSSAGRAVDFAIAVQREIATLNAQRGDPALRVRIGVHTGEVLRRDHDYIGHAVNLAARVATCCSGGQIAVSDLVRQLTQGVNDVTFCESRTVDLKGIPGSQRIHLVRWRNAEVA